MIVLVQDEARNNIACFNEILNDPEVKVVLRIGCINHKIHNLLYTDVFNSANFSSPVLVDLTNKLKSIYRKVYFKKNQIKEIIKKNYSIDLWQDILSFLENSEVDDFDCFIDKEKYSSLKRSNPTRWSSTLTMFKSFFKLYDVINQLLFNEKCTELLITDQEIELTTDMIWIFEIFEESIGIFQVVPYYSLKILKYYFLTIFSQLNILL